MSDNEYMEERPFLCRDPSGTEVVVIAWRKRFVIEQAMAERRDPWKYRTEDDRVVKEGPAFGHYELEDGTKLTTDDPNEPQAEDCA